MLPFHFFWFGWCISLWVRQEAFFDTFMAAILCVVCFTVISLPYLVQIRRDLGSWQISKKAALSVGVFQGQEDQGITGISSHPKRRLDVSGSSEKSLVVAGKSIVRLP